MDNHLEEKEPLIAQSRAEGANLTDELAARTARAKQFCAEIGCTGLSPDMCKNYPLDCDIVRKIGC